jgi:hypothetical protein
MINEYGKAGLVYPEDEEVLDSFADDHDEQRVEIMERHVTRTIYISLLTVLQGKYYPQQIGLLGSQIMLFGMLLLVDNRCSI